MSRVVVVSNRVPLPSAGVQAGGLAVVLGGLMQRRGGLWFGWDGEVAADAATRPVRVVHDDGVDYATVALTREEHDRYYNGFSNGVLWPLLHTMPELVQFDRRDVVVYRAVNARLAQTLAPMLRSDDLIWIHDYHLLPLAHALRMQGTRNTIGFFLHIPFPAADVLAASPNMPDFIRDMLRADLIGFQTESDLLNFATAAEMLAGAARPQTGLLVFAGRRIRLGVFPVEIEPREVALAAAEPDDDDATGSLERSLNGQSLIFGAERLDPTKGLIQRIAGYRRLLETRPAWRRRVTLLQIAATSRKEVSAYRALRRTLDQDTGALNADLGDPDWMPVRLVSRGVERTRVLRYMRQARVGLVTPLRDGMNLVAKEFVAAQDPENPGVLVLSSHAGAAQQLSRALLVNPRDPEAIADAIDMALRMPLAERQRRWLDLWSAIENRNPLAWGRSFLDAMVRTPVLAKPERPRVHHVATMIPRAPVAPPLPVISAPDHGASPPTLA